MILFPFSVFYVQETLGGKSEVFLDPNKMDKDGLIALSRIKFSHDGELCAYSVSKKGSDWNTIQVNISHHGGVLFI